MIPHVPKQLRRDDFRFYRVKPNQKLPFGLKWNTDNALQYNADEFAYWQGNYGVIGGFGNLIIIDFDDKDFYESVKGKLPSTFTVITAGKRLPHMYYILKGEMIRKKPIRDENNNTVCDIQAAGAGVVGPNSTINRRYYEVVKDVPIATIDVEELKEIFGLKCELEEYKKYTPDKDRQPVDLDWKKTKAYIALNMAGIDINYYGNMKCPFHDMKGTGNLSITPQGKIYCFDCLINMWADEFLMKAKNMRWRNVKAIFRLIKILYDERKEQM